MKNKYFKMGLYIVIVFISILVLYIGGVFAFSYFTEYKPAMTEELDVKKTSNLPEIIDNQEEFSMLIWNIGYCGLGKEDDFFYDGGKNTKPSTENYQKYLNGVYKTLEQNKYVDFIMLQEVDRDSWRSYSQDQMDLFSVLLDNHYYSFAKTYDVKYVPVPMFRPMGKVVSGMVTLSNRKPYKAVRNAFDVDFSWWKRIFMLDRCFITSHYKVNDKELVVINIHNSAFDANNELKPIELKTIKDYAVSEFNKGNYVIIGGDWNQNPPNFDVKKYDKSWNVVAEGESIPKDLFPADWSWIYPQNEPTQRYTDMPFEKGKTKTSVIDGFVLSPNIINLSVRCISNDFQFSDHNPILMNFTFKTDSIAVDSLAIDSIAN